MFDHLSEGRWWDRGLDLVTGCTPVSPGCAHCWSAEKTHRAGYQRNPKIQVRYGDLTDCSGRFTGTVRPQWHDLEKIGRARNPQVYTFWNDLFHEGVPDEFVDEVMVRITGRLEHFYIICTKRPERALKFYSDPSRSWVGNAFQKSLMIMTTAENQEMADCRLLILLQIPGVMHGVSVEPSLGLVDLGPSCLGGYPESEEWAKTGPKLPRLDWVICGGETGPHARPMHPEWVRSLRDQCQAAGVPFFFKGWGKWIPFTSWEAACNQKGWRFRGDSFFRRLLDGRTWDEVPEV
jgi:protein gp37